MFEETRKENPKLVFKDQNLESARNLLRQSLRRRLRSMDTAAGSRSTRARSLQRQCMLEAVSNSRIQRTSRTLNQGEHLKPTRPAPPPPKSNKVTQEPVSNFTNIRLAAGNSSRTIDLNNSLNGPNVHFEATSLIHIQKTDQKPKLPPKPKFYNKSIIHKEDTRPNEISTTDIIPMQNFSAGAHDTDSFGEDEDNVRYV